MAKSNSPVKEVKVAHQGIEFTITVYQAAVGYLGTWTGGGATGDAGFMPTVDDVVTLAKLRIAEFLRQKENGAA